MDEVGFSLEPHTFTYTEPNPVGTEIVITVNGRPLRELAREVEMPWAVRDGQPGLAGSYMGLSHWDVKGSTDHFLGTPKASWFDDGDTVLLGCNCGEWGCWPLTTQVGVTDEVVTWSGFRHGHRDWDLSALGPFEFRRDQYEVALAQLASTFPAIEARYRD